MFYYPGICYVVFLYFCYSHALEVVTVGSHSEHHFSGQDADGTNRPVEVKGVQFPSDKVKEEPPSHNKFELKPFKPTTVKIDSWHEADSSLSVTWSQPKLRYLRYFVLKYSQECEDANPFTEINYVLVNASYYIQKQGLTGPVKFKYPFVSVNEHAVRVSVDIWSLRKLDDNHNDGRLHFKQDRKPPASTGTVTKEFLQKKHLAEACLCNSSVIARIVKTEDVPPYIHGQVIVSGTNVFIPTDIKLIVNGSKVIKTAFNKTSITLKSFEPGTYYIMVTRVCPKGFSTECGKTVVPDVISDTVTVSRQRELPKRKQNLKKIQYSKTSGLC